MTGIIKIGMRWMLSLGMLLMATEGLEAQDFGLYELDFSPFGSYDNGNEFVDRNNPNKTGGAMWAYNYTLKNGIESVTLKSHQEPRGIREKVAAKVKASAPRHGSGHVKGKVGSYNHQTSDAGLAWRARRNAQIAEEKRRAAEKKAWEDYQRKVADDNRAAMVTAATNARLQAETDRKKANDQWNATVGAQQAQQRAREAHTVHGPQFSNQSKRLTGADKAGMLRQGNRTRMPKVSPTARRNMARRVKAPVKRTVTVDPQRQAMIRKAMAVKAELAARKRGEAQRLANEARRKELNRRIAEANKKADDGRQIVAVGKSMTRINLGPNATSTLGQDWNRTPITTPRIPERRKMTQKEYRRLIEIEMIENRPLTPQEEEYYRYLSLP